MARRVKRKCAIAFGVVAVRATELPLAELQIIANLQPFMADDTTSNRVQERSRPAFGIKENESPGWFDGWFGSKSVEYVAKHGFDSVPEHMIRQGEDDGAIKFIARATYDQSMADKLTKGADVELTQDIVMTGFRYHSSSPETGTLDRILAFDAHEDIILSASDEVGVPIVFGYTCKAVGIMVVQWDFKYGKEGGDKNLYDQGS